MTTDPAHNPLIDALDDLAASERDAAPAGLTDRVALASLPALGGLGPTMARVAELGALDRAAASAGLEARVHDASRGALAADAPALRLHGAAGRTLPTRRRVLLRPAVAMAALLGLVGTIAVLSSRPSATPESPGLAGITSTTDLEAELDARMSTLFLAMQDAPTGVDEDAEFKPEWLDDLSTPQAGSRNGS
jgi:hypothetical protein